MEKRRLLMDLLSNLVAFLVIFNLFAFVFSMLNFQLNERTAWIYLPLGIPFFFMFFLREKVKKMHHFIVIHIAMFALSFLALSDALIFGPLVGFTVLAAIYSLHRKGKGEWAMQGSTAVWVIGLLAALSALYASYLPEMDGVGVFLNISSLISLAAVVLYMHLDNMRFGLGLIGEHHKKTTNMSPVSNMLITVFLIIIIIFGSLSILFPSEAAVLVIARLLLNIILFPFQLMAFIFQSIIGEPVPEMPLEEMLTGDGNFVPEEGEEPPENFVFNRVISFIVGLLSALGLLAVAVTFLVLLFYRLYRAFGKKGEEGKSSLMPEDAISRLKFVLGDFKELLPNFKLSARHPVRRAYIKKVNSHIKQGLRVHPHYTPEVIADKIRPKEDIDELTQKYEKVRYGRT